MFAPLLLLPWALTDDRPVVRKLAVLVAIVPPITYTWLAFASPWKPHIPVRYFVPFALLGFSAPAVGVGLALRRFHTGGRSAKVGAGALAVLCVGQLLWLCGPRWTENMAAVRMDRLDALQKHRYVTYYNLGMGNIWPSQVDQVNDLIDVRTARATRRVSSACRPCGAAAVSDSVSASATGSPGVRVGRARGAISEWHERQQWKPVEEWGDHARWRRTSAGVSAS